MNNPHTEFTDVFSTLKDAQLQVEQDSSHFTVPNIIEDQFGRIKRKLRISVTDRCNFKCVYCMPEHPTWMNKKEMLSFDELYQFCELMVRSGIEKIRITGGEPLMRQGIVHFIRDLQKLRSIGLKRISMTTNAHYLVQHALALKSAGLDDLNISLDSLDPLQFFQLTQKKLQPVLDGIYATKMAGLPFKINTVLIKGKNDNQILPLVHWAIEQNVPLRFIEFMPLDGDEHWTQTDVVTEQDILAVLSSKFKLAELKQEHEPARIYCLDDRYHIGIISTISHSFCGECDRIRLTAQGELYNCLFATQGLMLRPLLSQLNRENNQENKENLQKLLIEKMSHYIWNKAKGYHYIQKQSRKISMHMLGG